MQLGPIAGQDVPLQMPGEPLDGQGHDLRPVRGVACQDDEHPAMPAMHEARQDAEEPLGRAPFLSIATNTRRGRWPRSSLPRPRPAQAGSSLLRH